MEKLQCIQNEEEKEKLIAKTRAMEKGLSKFLNLLTYNKALLRRKRKKMKLNDFQIIDIIGKGGFGKVLSFFLEK